MIDINILRENPELVKQSAENKNAKVDIDKALELDEIRRKIIVEVENLKALRNKVTQEIADAKKNKEDAQSKIDEMRGVSSKIKELDAQLSEVEANFNDILLQIPNIHDESVPVGKTENENIITKTVGETTTEKKPDHIEIAKRLGILDFERGAKVSGSGFAFYTGKGAALERALINFFLDENTSRGYYEMMTPFMVNEESMRGTGQLPKMAEDMYHMQEDNMYMIPTAEVPLTNFHRDDMIPYSELNKQICGYSPCFRREAGSYGKDVRGFLRVHQFNKVELVKFTKPEDSWTELDKMVVDVENLLTKLGFTYRLNQLCTGDTSFASAKTIDLEVWSEGEQNWLEVSSCSNFVDFQARRANIRFKRTADSKPEFVHTLNGSALATPRILVALIEKYYDGEKINIPECLHPYLRFKTI
ncbi:MAG: serine--tRNA ligase [Ignavibacteriae bacterium HGW-Ignavibacteriae-4]|jgi:seryl-tRNA synthetase|nr:MAG: serine--tRNA ligase [Ignavibacteriae bacterium HGW-Ignavibacteriae-4]